MIRNKVLPLEILFNNLNFAENTAGGVIEMDPEIFDNYLAMQGNFPKSFFDFVEKEHVYNPIFVSEFKKFPDLIPIKFELFAVGDYKNKQVAVFKPWIVATPSIIFGELERFHLIVPIRLFVHIINHLLFLDKIKKETFYNVRVLQDLPLDIFNFWGLQANYSDKKLDTPNLEITRINNINKTEILLFYEKHWSKISQNLENVYFNPKYSTWYRVFLKKENETIGFIRLYHRPNVFFGEVSIEFVFAENYRLKYQYEIETLSFLIKFIKNASTALYIGAEVNDEYNVLILKKLGFQKRENTNFLLINNYYMSFLNDLAEYEIYNNEAELEIEPNYLAKFYKYLI